MPRTENDVHSARYSGQMIVYHSRLIVCESDGNMCIPKGRKTENNILEDTTMTKNEDRINKLFKELVPETGKAAGREPLAYDPQFFYDTIVELMEQDAE